MMQIAALTHSNDYTLQMQDTHTKVNIPSGNLLYRHIDFRIFTRLLIRSPHEPFRGTRFWFKTQTYLYEYIKHQTQDKVLFLGHWIRDRIFPFYLQHQRVKAAYRDRFAGLAQMTAAPACEILFMFVKQCGPICQG